MYVKGGCGNVVLARHEVVGVPDPNWWPNERAEVPSDDWQQYVVVTRARWARDDDNPNATPGVVPLAPYPVVDE